MKTFIIGISFFTQWYNSCYTLHPRSNRFRRRIWILIYHNLKLYKKTNYYTSHLADWTNSMLSFNLLKHMPFAFTMYHSVNTEAFIMLITYDNVDRKIVWQKTWSAQNLQQTSCFESYVEIAMLTNCSYDNRSRVRTIGCRSFFNHKIFRTLERYLLTT